MTENRLPSCFNCGGPVHGGPCCQATAEAPACQACLYRAAQDNGLCDICDNRERIEMAIAIGGPMLMRVTAEDIRAASRDDWERVVADWLAGLGHRWTVMSASDAEMDAAEAVARAYYKGFVKW